MTALTIALAVALGVSGCVATPEIPEETTAAWTEAEAFAAAEETYRSYVDALNEVDLSDPDTFETVYAWTTGDANTGARESFSQMHADGLTVGGESIVRNVSQISASDSRTTIVACLDVAAVTLVDPSGESTVAADRPDIQIVRVDTVPDQHSASGQLIELLDGYEDDSICGL